MRSNCFAFGRRFWGFVLLPVVLLAGCGTFEVDLESEEGPEATTARATVAATAGPTGDPAAPEPPATIEPTIIVTEEVDRAQAVMTLRGEASAVYLPEGIVLLRPESESPFVDGNGEVAVRISEWARIANTEGALVELDDFSRGIRVELKLLFRHGELTSEDVTVLEMGVPPPEENPLYTEVTGRVTPLAETPVAGAGAGAIQLFEMSSGEGVVDPGATLTVYWAFNGESGTICVDQFPLPVTRSCYRDLPSSGSMPLTVPAEARQAMIYRLSVQVDGQVESAVLRVTLSEDLDCQFDWFFEHTTLLGCATGEAIALRPQAQYFERGILLRIEGTWLGQAPYLLAFVWDKQSELYAMTEGPLLDPWYPDMGDQVVGREPPEGLIVPSRGFGLLWDGQMDVSQIGEPRTWDGLRLIGWATGPVTEYDAQYQCAEERLGNATCLLNLPDGQIFSLGRRTE
jgi:hypothetical protein